MKGVEERTSSTADRICSPVKRAEADFFFGGECLTEVVAMCAIFRGTAADVSFREILDRIVGLGQNRSVDWYFTVPRTRSGRKSISQQERGKI
jgi:hypothetical protein